MKMQFKQPYRLQEDKKKKKESPVKLNTPGQKMGIRIVCHADIFSRGRLN